MEGNAFLIQNNSNNSKNVFQELKPPKEQVVI